MVFYAKEDTMIYLDNGATSYPKPDVVGDAVYDYIKNVGSNINRGGYAKVYPLPALCWKPER